MPYVAVQVHNIYVKEVNELGLLSHIEYEFVHSRNGMGQLPFEGGGIASNGHYALGINLLRKSSFEFSPKHNLNEILVWK